MRKARTITRIVAVYLLLGLVTTWAVAWGLALLPPGTRPLTYLTQYPAPAKISDRSAPDLHSYGVGRTGLGSARVRYTITVFDPQAMGGFAFRRLPQVYGLDLIDSPWIDLTLCFDLSGIDGWGMRRVGLPEGMESLGGWGIDDARGFPFLSQWCSWSQQIPRPTTSVNLGQAPVYGLVGGFAISDHPSTSLLTADALRALPYYPIWSGLALNTAFYALLFFIVVRTAKAFTRSHRHARGLCPRCKYDREFDYRMPCPECGHHASARRAAVV